MAINDSNTLYRSVWRWHFYAGLFCLPFIILLSITGAIYLFKPQFNAWQEAPYRNLSVSSVRATPNQHIAAALSVFPDAKFRSYQLPQSASDAVIINVVTQGERYVVYVHPNTTEVLASHHFNSRVMQVVKRLHGSLLAGVWGAVLVELAACWAIVLIISGLYLWWPRGTGLAGIVYPRFTGGARQVWRDVHAVSGFWISALVLFLLVSGLPWTQVWGQAFKASRSWVSNMQSADWQSDAGAQRLSWRANVVSRYDLDDAVYSTAERLSFPAPSELSVSNEATMEWKLSSMTQNRPQRADAWIASGSGNVLEKRTFDDKPTLDKVIGVGIAAHEGHLFGWANQLLGLLVALFLLVLCLSGVVMWRRRRPVPGTLGAPPALPQGVSNRVIAVFMLLLALLLPMLLLSMVSIVLFERLLLPRLPFVARWLGCGQANTASC